MKRLELRGSQIAQCRVHSLVRVDVIEKVADAVVCIVVVLRLKVVLLSLPHVNSMSKEGKHCLTLPTDKSGGFSAVPLAAGINLPGHSPLHGLTDWALPNRSG